MTDLELEEFDQLPENEQKSRLLNLWTLKESYMKAIGKGFSLSPKSFSFLFNKGEKIQFQENPIESAVNEFSFKLFECSSLYKVALCHTKEISEIGVYRVTPYWEIKNLNISLELFI